MNPLTTFNNYVGNIKPTTACLLPEGAENSEESLSTYSEENLAKVPIADIRTKNLVEVDEKPFGLYVDDGVNKYFILE